jgi:hypothetical protein
MTLDRMVLFMKIKLMGIVRILVLAHSITFTCNQISFLDASLCKCKSGLKSVFEDSKSC